MSTDDGITEQPPAPKSAAPTESDDRPPSIRRPPPTSSSGVVIAVVAGAAFLGLCICVAPVVLLLGIVPMRMVHHEERVAVEQAHDRQVVAMEKAVKADAGKLVKGRLKGAVSAEAAIAKNQLLLKEYPPLPAPAWHADYIKLLKERCKCDYQVIAGQLDPAERDEILGWNEVMELELGARFGGNILADLRAEGEARWRDRIKGKK